MMIQVPEGARVAYTGSWADDSNNGLSIGDEGKVLEVGLRSCHVLMRTGSAKGQVVLLHPATLTILSGGSRGLVDDSLSDGSMDEPRPVTAAVRAVYDHQGVTGVITTLANRGELPDFEQVAEEAVGRVVATVRNHPTIMRVVSELDEDEAETFINTVAVNAVEEALG